MQVLSDLIPHLSADDLLLCRGVCRSWKTRIEEETLDSEYYVQFYKINNFSHPFITLTIGLQNFADMKKTAHIYRFVDKKDYVRERTRALKRKNVLDAIEN